MGSVALHKVGKITLLAYYYTRSRVCALLHLLLQPIGYVRRVGLI
ncbi:hypothetical protein Y026_3080 [Burkholderia pseudomallei TSV28]|nr:hypothetical protein Y026_3080 [Burkholderia pseudomallei TSV28]